MIRNFTLSALIFGALSGAALAASPTPGLNAGDVQLALSAGVEPGRYTTAELIAIIEARNDNEADVLSYYLSGANRDGVTGAAAGWDQLAATIGVEPGKYTPAELQQLEAALRDGDREAVDFILSGENRREANPAEVVTPGEAQLAAAVGVDPAEYTLAELIALQPEVDD